MGVIPEGTKTLSAGIVCLAFQELLELAVVVA